VLLSESAYAQTTAPVFLPSTLCANTTGVFLEKTVTCATKSIQAITTRFLTQMNGYYLTIYWAISTLAIVVFGLKLMFGAAELKMGKDGFILLFKIGGIIYFVTNAQSIYEGLMDSVGFLMQGVSDAAASGSTICTSNASGQPLNSIWARYDCILGKLLGYGAVSGLAGGILAIIVGFIFTGPVGIAIFVISIFFFFMLFMVILRAVNSFLMAVIGMSFMFMMSFMFIPLVLFQATMSRFSNWLSLMLSYLLMPVVSFAFLGFATIVFENTVFVGPYSLFTAIAGQAVPPTQSVGDVLKTKGAYSEDKVKFGNISKTPDKDAKCGEVDDAGLLGGYVASLAKTFLDDFIMTINVFVIDPLKMVAATAVGGYLLNIMIALMVTVVTLYVMFAMMTQLSQFVFEIATGGKFNSANIGKAQIPGEEVIRKAADYAMETTMALITGGASVKARAASKLSELVTKRR